MSAVFNLTGLDVYETGQEPEYVANHLVRYEAVGTEMVRLYFASERGSRLRMEYTVLVSCQELVLMARSAMEIAAQVHNHVAFAPAIEKSRTGH